MVSKSLNLPQKFIALPVILILAQLPQNKWRFKRHLFNMIDIDGYLMGFNFSSMSSLNFEPIEVQ